MRDDRGKFAIRLFAQTERKIGLATREREAEEVVVEEEEEAVVEEKEEEDLQPRRGGEGGKVGDGPRVGGVGGSGGRLFFYLSLTLRRERTHTGSVE